MNQKLSHGYSDICWRDLLYCEPLEYIANTKQTITKSVLKIKADLLYTTFIPTPSSRTDQSSSLPTKALRRSCMNENTDSKLDQDVISCFVCPETWNTIIKLKLEEHLVTPFSNLISTCIYSKYFRRNLHGINQKSTGIVRTKAMRSCQKDGKRFSTTNASQDEYVDNQKLIDDYYLEVEAGNLLVQSVTKRR